MDVCCECCLSDRGLCDELITRPEGVLPTVVRRCVCSRNLVDEEAMAHWRGGGAVAPQTDNQFASFRRCFRRRPLLVIYINRTQLPNSLRTSLTPACFTPFCFNAHCQFTTLLNLRFLIFGLTLCLAAPLNAARRTQNTRRRTKLGGCSLTAK